MTTALFAAPLLGTIPQVFDDNGNPVSGGSVTVYQAGTVVLESTYPTYANALADTSPNANPITLDSAGRPTGGIGVFVQAGRFYKVVVKNSTGTTIADEDFISPASGYPYPDFDQWVKYSVAPSFNSTVLFNLNGVDATAIFVRGRRIKATQTSGTVYGTITDVTYGAPNTTVRVILDSSAVLDGGLSAVWYGLTTPTAQVGAAPPAIGDRQTWVNAYLSANQAILTGAYRKIQFETKFADLLSEYDNTVNFRFTPYYQSSGTYRKRFHVRAQMTFDTSIVSANFGLALNGSAAPPGVTLATQNLGIAGCAVLLDYIWEQPASTGQFLEIYVQPSANVTIRGGATATWLQITSLPN